jgi:hypothetical protein
MIKQIFLVQEITGFQVNLDIIKVKNTQFKVINLKLNKKKIILKKTKLDN